MSWLIRRFEIMLVTLAALVATISTPVSASTQVNPSDFKLVLYRLDLQSGDEITLPTIPNGYVAHSGDTISARVETSQYPYHSWGYSEPTIKRTTEYSGTIIPNLDITPCWWEWGMWEVNSHGTSRTAIVQTAVSVYDDSSADLQSCLPQNFGLSTGLKVIPVPKLQTKLLEPTKVSNGCTVVGFYVRNIGVTKVDDLSLSFYETVNGIDWHYGDGASSSKVFQTLKNFGDGFQFVQVWRQGPTNMAWTKVDLNTIYPLGGTIIHFGPVNPGQAVGIQLIIKPTN